MFNTDLKDISIALTCDHAFVLSDEAIEFLKKNAITGNNDFDDETYSFVVLRECRRERTNPNLIEALKVFGEKINGSNRSDIRLFTFQILDGMTFDIHSYDGLDQSVIININKYFYDKSNLILNNDDYDNNKKIEEMNALMNTIKNFRKMNNKLNCLTNTTKKPFCGLPFCSFN